MEQGKAVYFCSIYYIDISYLLVYANTVGGEGMNILETIRMGLDDMTRSERQVASFYLANPNEFAFCTLDAIALKIDTSTTSVLRFCRKIGFQGYKDFQAAVRSQISSLPQLPDKYRRTVAEGNQLLLRMMHRDIGCVEDTVRELDNSALEQAVTEIAQADRVYTFGMRESLALSHYSYTRLLSVRPRVEQLRSGVNGEVENLLGIGEKDVCLVFLFHRYTRQAVQILHWLHSRGCKVILVTNPPLDEVEHLADILLPCYVDCGGIKNTAVAPVVLCDCLCNAVAAQLGDSALSYMKETEELFRLNDIL